MSKAQVQASARAMRLRRFSLWALPVALIAALALRGRETATNWWRASDLFPQPVRFDASAPLAGADWRVVSLQRVAERADGTTIALLELEATVRDPAPFALLPCRIALADGTGQRWLPTFLAPAEVSRLPSRRNSQARTCGPALASKPEAGAVLAIAESFLLPRAAFGQVDVVISLAGARPHYLRFARGS